MTPADYWKETDANRSARVAQQDADRACCFNDPMDLVYEADIDELVAELLRLHRQVRDPHTIDVLRRIFPERTRTIEEYAS
jgi:hypothetical protein